MNMPLLGVDLGGTKIEVAALARDDGRFLVRERVPTPVGGYEDLLRTVGDLVQRAEAALGVQGLPLGIGIPGCVSPATGLVKGANTIALNGRPLDRDLARLLARPVRIENDANCLAVSEAVDGAGAGARMVFAVILGTGVGAGIVFDGQPWPGAHGIAGEWGHNPAPRLAEDRGFPAPHCWCGRGACVESLLSGPGLAADHLRHGGAMLDARAVVAAAQAGDSGARATVERHAERLARALAQVINLLDPDVIVLGGGLSRLPHLYQRVPALWGQWVFCGGAREPVRTRLLPSLHGDASGVRGAAWLGRGAA